MTLKSEIAQALEAHAAWRKHFRDFLNGREAFDTDSAGDGHACAFGRWFDGDGRRLLPADLWEEVRDAHDAFHRLVAGIIAKIRERQFASAHDDLAPDGPLNAASERLKGALLKATLHEPGGGGG